jgi:antitoxin (DNA-binding transcriptional repressor) of toxin-antitoxin stability system
MRELGKLTADQVQELDHAVPVTSNGLPVAWLVPLTPSERRRAEMIAAGRLHPGRPRGLGRWSPLPPVDDEPTLSELLLEMRERERT